MFVSGVIVGTSVSLLTVIILKVFNNRVSLDNKKYKVEIKSGHSYHSGIVKFRETE